MRLTTHSYNTGVVDKIHPVFATSPKTADNRNAIVQNLQGTHLFMVDADMTFTPDTLERMLKTSDANPDAVITGLGFMGSPPFFPAIFQWNEEQLNASPVAKWPDHPFEVDVCGSFGMLIPASILTALGPKCFDHMFFTNSETGESKEIRHDFAFCLRARKAGFRIICNPAIEFGHIRPAPITAADWQATMQFMEEQKGTEPEKPSFEVAP